MRILLDVDGLICDFMTAVVAVIEDASGKRITPEQAGGWMQLNKLGLSKTELTFVESVINSRGFCSELSVIPGAQDGVAALRASGCSVSYVTSPWTGNETWEYERRSWLRRHGFMAGGDTSIVSTDDKKLVQGDFFIDDRIQNVISWRNHNPSGKALIWETPWNQTQKSVLPRISTWSQLIEEVQKCRAKTTSQR